MFSFHKPRIYRSASGCCICRAKSSSSRFTDSRRYEGDFYACFKLSECRSGDICNACVLLVKRWKKLPKGSPRNWNHVVDARAGHGSKPISKINKVKKTSSVLGGIKPKPTGIQLSDKMRTAMKKHLGPKESYISPLGRARETSPSGCSDDVQMDCISSESGSYHSSLAASPTPSEVGEDDVTYTNSLRTKRVKATMDAANNNTTRSYSHQEPANSTTSGPSKTGRGKDVLIKSRRSSDTSHSSFLDLSFWKREKTCCGIIFKGPCGEVLLDRRFLSPCFLRAEKNASCGHSDIAQKSVQRSHESETPKTGTEESNPDGTKKVVAVAVDCISVDSGYDDSSNSAPDAFKLHSNNNGVSCSEGKASVDSMKAISTSPLVVTSNVSGKQLQVSPKLSSDLSILSVACESFSTGNTN